MATPRLTTPRRVSTESSNLPPLDISRLKGWITVVIDYLKAVNNSDWFSIDAENRGEGRLFFNVEDMTPEKEITHAQKALDNIMKGAAPHAEVYFYLLETFEKHIQHWLPAWQPTLELLKKHDLKKLKKHQTIDIKEIDYFYAGRNIIDAFWAPIEQSNEWPSFWTAFSQKFTPKNAALKELIRGALVYNVMLTWSKRFNVPKTEANDEIKAELDRETAKMLTPLLNLLTKTFNDSAVFLLHLFNQSIATKKNEPLLVQRIILTTEYDEPTLKLVHKTEALPFIQELKLKLGHISQDKMEDITSTTPLLSPSSGRHRAMSMPPALGVKPFLLSESPLFRHRQASLSEQSKPEADSANTLK